MLLLLSLSAFFILQVYSFQLFGNWCLFQTEFKIMSFLTMSFHHGTYSVVCVPYLMFCRNHLSMTISSWWEVLSTVCVLANEIKTKILFYSTYKLRPFSLSVHCLKNSEALSRHFSLLKLQAQFKIVVRINFVECSSFTSAWNPTVSYILSISFST